MSALANRPRARRLAIALVVAGLACVPAAVSLAGGGADAGERLGARAAVARALADPEVRRFLARTGYSRHRTLPLDDRLQRVSFFDDNRIVLDVAVGPKGVEHSTEYGPDYVRFGSEVLQRPPLLMFLACLAFALLTLRLPLWSATNLDVLALTGFTAVIVLQNERLLEPGVYIGSALVVYLIVRLLRRALRPAEAAVTRPLLDALTSRWDAGVRRRTLALGAAGAVVALVLLSVPSGRVVDVGFASIAGATDLLDGHAPYGHLPPEILHGDTYPLLAYAFYMPAAALAPVEDSFSSLDGALWVSVAGALLAAAAIWLVAARLEGRRGGGGRLAIAWLLFPPTLVGASSGTNDLVAAAFVAGALALATLPGRSTLLLALAGWVKVVPFALLPLWLARLRPADRARSVVAAGAVCCAVVCWLLVLGGAQAAADMVKGISFQAERGSLLSVWTLLGADELRLIVQCAACALVALAAIRTARDPALGADLRRVAALSAAVLLTFQLAGNYWTPVYLTWVFPLVAAGLLMGDRARSERGERAPRSGLAQPS